jgi:predicted TPR repeat methyltransferase
MIQMKRKSKKPIPDSAVEADALSAAVDLPAAIAQLQRAAGLDPSSGAAQYALGCAWLDAGEAERATEILARLDASHPQFAARAAEKMAQAEAMQRANRSPAPYVRHLFDQFAPDYERRMLGELSYRAPCILRGLADMLVAAEPGTLDILDLGCGTGLAGESFKDLARRLDGVDLSPGMIGQARALGIYDELAIADVETLLGQEGRSYDLILAADVLVYLGDLKAIFRGAASHLKPGGFFLFTVEKQTGSGYALGPKRRYRHSPDYLREQAAGAGFEVMGLLECSPRQDATVPVDGLAAALQRA